MKNYQIPKILFVGGGSGGHLSIIKGLIDYLAENGCNYKNNIMVVGSKLGMINDPGPSLDEKYIPKLGVTYKFIRSGKLHRALKLQTFKLVWGVVPGFFDAKKILQQFRPDIVFATGGYVIVPMVLAAKLMRIKIVLHEQTMTAGLANRIASHLADKIFISFKESEAYYPKHKTVLTGNIIRKEVFDNRIDKARHSVLISVLEEAKETKRDVLYITGGSLGAHKVNMAILKDLEMYLGTFTLVWQTGDNQLHKDYEQIQTKVNTLNKELRARVYVTKFINEEIGHILHVAKYVICRPGANTLLELAALNKPAIMVPLWVTSKNDQLQNAKWYVDNFAGAIIKEKDLNFANVMRQISGFGKNDKPVRSKVDYADAAERVFVQLRKIVS